MAFRYQYKQYNYKERIKELLRDRTKNRPIIAASVVLVSAFLVYVIADNVTGFVTYTENLEFELNETKNKLTATEASLQAEEEKTKTCKSNLENVNNDLSVCNSKMSESESYLVECEDRRDELQKYSDELNSLLVECKDEKEEFKDKYESKLSEFNSLLRNSVNVICCSRYDIQNEIVLNWSLAEGSVQCDIGNNTINCGTGEMDY